MALSTSDYTVGCICPMGMEVAPVKAILDHEHTKPPTPRGNNTYIFGEISGHNVVIAVLSEVGNIAAAIKAAQLKHDFPSIKFGLLVGFGGGVPNIHNAVDIRLGDVVVGSGVVQYDMGKQTVKGFQRTGALKKPPSILLEAIQQLIARRELSESQIHEHQSSIVDRLPNEREKYSYPTTAKDLLFRSSYEHQGGATCNDCNVLQTVQRCDRAHTRPYIHYGTIGSANKVVKNAFERDSLSRGDLNIICVEMEAAGVMYFPYLVIRGICDYADSHKNDQWQPYAAATAAAYAKELLSVIQPQAVGQKVQTRCSSPYWANETYSQALQAFRTHDYEGFKNTKSKCEKNTGTWFFEQEQFRAWLNSPRSSCLWLSADPGSGKSVLCRRLVDTHLAIPGPKILYYFFDGSKKDNVAETALQAILHQLFLTDETLIEIAVDYFHQHGKNSVRELNSLWSIFRKCMSDSRVGTIICVLDAVDEFGGGNSEEQFLKFVNDLTDLIEDAQDTGKTFKLAVSSRPYFLTNTISRELQQRVEVFSINGAQEYKSLAQDVETFISQRLKCLVQTLKLTEEEVELVDFRLKAGRRQNFLCAHFLLETLRKKPPSTAQALLDAVNDLPRGLEDHYRRVLTLCTDHKKARAIFSILLAAKRALNVGELAMILLLQPGFQGLTTTTDRATDIIRDICGMLVQVVSGKVYLIHDTLRTYLLNPETEINRSKDRRDMSLCKHSINVDEGEARLSLACTRIVSVERPLRGEQPEFREYAHQHWGVHLSRTLRSVRCRHPIVHIEKMIGYGLDLQMLDSDGKSLLHRAVDTHVDRVNREVVRGIISHGGLVQTADRDNMTCLHYATLRSNVALVQMLLEAGFDSNVAVRRKPGAIHETHDRKDVAHGGLTALHAAAYFGRPNMIEPLLNAGANAQLQDEDGNTALHLVLSSKFEYKSREDLWSAGVFMLESMPEYLFDIDDEVEKKDAMHDFENNWRESRHRMLEILCSGAGLSLHQRDIYGNTALHHVPYDHKESARRTTQYLLEHGLEGSLQDGKGIAPIHLAARAGNVQCLEILLKGPKDLLIQDKRGWNVLHHAALSGCESTVEFIIGSSTSLEIETSLDYQGMNALHHAVEGFPVYATIDKLIQLGVDPRHKDLEGRDPLAYYIEQKLGKPQSDIVQRLIESGADLDYLDKEGRNLATLAVNTKWILSLGILLLLQEAGVDLLAVDAQGRSILHYAAIFGSVNIDLLRHLDGCMHLDLDMRDFSGTTALQYLTAMSQKEYSGWHWRTNRWKVAEVDFRNYRLQAQGHCECKDWRRMS
ncbi:hypothetical protein LTR84_003526 [Exophiala bonariae]|uniref:Nucleoside phosphorylase domain-containing protein n=1 Tax=Exophiala bonariae TaxID=1690606 RepID=A0AAV9NBW7_9EURO|nr:hypothetical protein LTR84_003526 [Exophiala bonariae]